MKNTSRNKQKSTSEEPEKQRKNKNKVEEAIFDVTSLLLLS